ncbi:MAG: sensor histidine kinase [Thermotogota bacterium]
MVEKVKESSFYSNLSNIIMEISKVNDLDSAYKTLSKISNGIIDIDKEFFFKISKDEKVHEIFKTSYNSDIEDMVIWSNNNLDVSIFPEENFSYIFVPVFSLNTKHFVYTAITKKDDFSNEMMMLFRIISFMTGNLFENLVLYDKILNKNFIIEKNKNFLNSILNSTNDSIVVFSENKDINFKNEKYDNLDEVLQEKLNSIIQRTLDTEKNQSEEKEIEDKFYSIDSNFLEFENEKNVLLVIRDISGTKELEKMKKIDKMKMEFLSMMSHELRTPLSAIKAYSDTIIDSYEMLDNETLIEFFKTIQSETNHLSRLLNDLLDFSKLELKTLNLEKTNFNINELIQEICNTLEEFANNNKVDVEFENEEPIEVFMDRTRMRQVIFNLIQNAIKYSDNEKNNKFVKITTEINDNNIIIKIKDNSIGIKSEDKEKIFDKFYRSDTSLTYEIQGTGVGLSIVKDMVELHDGTIELDTELGEGSTFTLTIPRGVENE